MILSHMASSCLHMSSYPIQTKVHDFYRFNIRNTTYLNFNFQASVSSTLRKAEDLMPRDIMSSEPRHWMVFGQLVMPVQCCAGAWRRTAGAPAQHCTGMTSWPKTIRCLGQDDLMSLGIESSAFLNLCEHNSCIYRKSIADPS